MSEPIKLLHEAPEVEPKQAWPEPLPLYRDPEAPEAFPLEALGSLAPVVRETLRIVQAPDALVAASYLAATSLVVQGLANVVVDGRVYPLSLYFLTVAESGERKTAVDTIATAPLRERQKTLHLTQQDEATAWEGRYTLWEAERKAIITRKNTSRAERETALEQLGPPPSKPWSGIMLTSEPTYEGLVKLLADGWPSVGLVSNEGGSFLGGHALSQDHRLRTLSGLSELWDGQAIDRVRAGDGATLLYNRRAALHLMAQPVVARSLLADPLAQGLGFLARMLVTEPLSTAGGRWYVSESVLDTPEYQAYAARLTRAFEIVEQVVLNDPEARKQGLSLKNIPLTPEAKKLWTNFYNHVERNLNGELLQIRAFASKLAEHALRLAGVLALFENPEATSIGKDAMEQGIALAEFYGAESFRLVGGYRIPRPLALAAEVLNWLLEHCKAKNRRVFHLAEVYRLGPPAVRSARAAREVIRILEEHGYLAHRPNIEVDGKPRKDAWEVNPHALPQV